MKKQLGFMHGWLGLLGVIGLSAGILAGGVAAETTPRNSSTTGGEPPPPPDPAYNPLPTNGALAIAVDTTFSWEEGGRATSYNLYINNALVVSNLTDKNYDPGELDHIAAYTWRVDAVSPVGVATGTLWRFTTQAAFDPDIDDSDLDGLPNAWENRYGFNPNQPDDITSDPDADSAGLWKEYVSDTDPTNAGSVLKLFPTNAPSFFGIEFDSSTNRNYSLLWRTNLPENTWWAEPGQTNLPGTGSRMALPADNSTFYRCYRLEVKIPQ